VIRPRFRDSLSIYDGPDRELLILDTVTRTLTSYAVDELTLALLDRIDGATDVGDIVDGTLEACPTAGRDTVAATLAFLAEENLVVESEQTDAGHERYARQRAFFDEASMAAVGLPMSGSEAQDRLDAATVVVIGAGGTGSWVLHALAAAGVGRLCIADCDAVAESNLGRQALYSGGDVGQPKLVAARHRLAAINSNTGVELVPRLIQSSDDVASLIGPSTSVVVNAADQPNTNTTSDWVSEAAMAAGVPHLVGGGYAWNVGGLGLSVLPGITACWACARRAASGTVLPEGAVLRRGTRSMGSVAPITAVIGNLWAWDILRMLLGAWPTLADRIGELDFLDLSITWRSVPRDAACERCANVGTG
jgi:molybdopterin/thiamine biosynthesis adenylyltransferase